MVNEVLKADVEDVRKTLATLHRPGALVELCAIGEAGIVSGYYDDHDALSLKAKQLSDSAKYAGVYITANPVKRSVLGQRKANTTYRNVHHRTRDEDIAELHWLILDIDPGREPGASATEKQKACANWCLTQTVAFLRRKSVFPEPILADSGNGFYALYSVHEPNNGEAKDLFKRATKAISAKCSIKGLVEGEMVTVAVIDEVTYNPARLIKLFGTVSRKGRHTTMTPHRLSRLLNVPRKMVPLTRAQLEKVAAVAPVRPQLKGAGPGITPTKITEFLERAGIEIKSVSEESDGGKKWILKACPFDPDHTNSPAVFLSADGIPGFKCFHANTCGDKHWREFRTHVENKMGTRFRFVDGPYFQTDAGIIMRTATKKGEEIEKQLTNFHAHIITDIEEDNGIETAHTLEIEATCGGNQKRFHIEAAQFQAMNWPIEKMGARATVMAGMGTRDHARAAIQLFSEGVVHQKVFTHTGWRKIGDSWVYLHSGGGIGADGLTEAVRVKLPSNLAPFRLPEPQEGARLKKAVRASLRFLQVAKLHRTVPVYGAIWRAVLGQVDFSEHATGPTGTFKSSVFALAMQHFGAGFDARHLPASWSSTANANAALQFIMKDAPIVIDDFVPRGSASDVERQQRDADRIFRGQGNNSGRGRLGRDGSSLRDPSPPRGLTLSTGEDVPRGESLNSRLWLIDFSTGDVDCEKLTECQSDAGSGLYAEAMAGFVRWLAPQYESVKKDLPALIDKYRENASRDGQHARTPEITANLMIGIEYFVRFAKEAGALTDDEAKTIRQDCWRTLKEVAAAQSRSQASEEPARRFVDLISSAIVRGDAYLDGMVNGENPRGRLIGWLTEDDEVHLEPDSAFAAANQLASLQGESLSVSKKTLWKRLRDRGFLARYGKEDGRNTVVRTIGTRRQRVLCIRKNEIIQIAEPTEAE